MRGGDNFVVIFQTQFLGPDKFLAASNYGFGHFGWYSWYHDLENMDPNVHVLCLHEPTSGKVCDEALLDSPIKFRFLHVFSFLALCQGSWT